MTFAEAVGVSALRAGIVAAFSVALAGPLQPMLRQSRVLILWPLLVPSLVLGFAYRNLSLSLLHHPGWNELLYAALLVVQGVPLAALVLHSLPSPSLSGSASHLLTLLRKGEEGRTLRRLAPRWKAWLHGPGPHRIIAASIVFLIAFQEAEVAALVRAPGWPEWLFMQQSGGAFLPDAWPYVRWPALLAGVVVLIPLACQWALQAGKSTLASPESTRADRPGSRTPRAVFAGWTIVSLTLAVLWPIVVIGPDAARGIGVVMNQPRFLGEIGDALMIGLISGLAAIGLTGGLLNVARRSAVGRVLLLAACVPGLLGGLVWGLMVKEGVNRWLPQLAETPVPLVFAVTLALVPRAILILLLLQDYGDEAATHLARLLSRHFRSAVRQSSDDLGWQMTGQRWFWGTSLLCLQGYLELSITFLLRPPNVSSAPVRLYNFLHYGRVPGLAAMLVLCLIAPIAVANAALTLRRLVLRLRAGAS